MAKPVKFEKPRNGVYCKADFLMSYGVGMKLFEGWLGDLFMKEIGWIPGERQKFPPNTVQRIFEKLGEPD